MMFFNPDDRSYMIDAIRYGGNSFTLFPRGVYQLKRYTEFEDKSETPDETNYIKPDSETYIKKLLPIRVAMDFKNGDTPNLLLRGAWSLVVKGHAVGISPLRFAVYPSALSRQDWERLDPRNLIDIKTAAIPRKPPSDADVATYLVYSPDRSATIENPYFAQTPTVRSPNGAMVFISGSAALPIEDGWAILGHTYHDAWSDPGRLATYNSIYPPDENGHPRPFGYFAGAEAAMLGGEPFSAAPVTRAADIIEMNVPTPVSTPAPPASIDNRGGIFNAAPNSGTQTVINGPPPPALKAISETKTDNADGTQTMVRTVEMNGPYAGSLVVSVRATGLVRASIGSIRTVSMPGNTMTVTGGDMLRNVMEGDGFWSATVPQPTGQYALTVTAPKGTKPVIELKFE